MRDVIVLIGPGQIGQAIARRVGVGKHLLLADVRQENADAAAEVLGNAGYEVSVATVDASSREAVHALVETATGLGDVRGLIPMLPAFHPRRPHRRRSSKSIFMARRSCWKSSATSLPAVAPVSSSRRSLGIAFPRSPSNKTRRWPRRPWRSCSTFLSFGPTKCRTLCTPTSWRSAAT